MCSIMRLFVFCERPSKDQTELDLALVIETRSLPIITRSEARRLCVACADRSVRSPT